MCFFYPCIIICIFFQSFMKFVLNVLFIATTNVLALKHDFWYYIIAIKSVHARVLVNFEVLIDRMYHQFVKK